MLHQQNKHRVMFYHNRSCSKILAPV